MCTYQFHSMDKILTEHLTQYEEAEEKYAQQYLNVKAFLETHPKSSIIQDSIQIHVEDKEDFMKMMYKEIMI